MKCIYNLNSTFFHSSVKCTVSIILQHLINFNKIKQTTQLNIYVLTILEGLFQLVEDEQIEEYLYTCIYQLDFSLLIISRWISPCGMTLFR